MIQINLGSLILIQISPEGTHLKAYIEDKISSPLSSLGCYQDVFEEFNLTYLTLQSSLLSSLEYSLMSYFCKERKMFPLTCLLSNPQTDINSNKFFLLFIYNNQTVTKLSPCFFSTWNAWTKHNHVISYCRFSIILPLYFRVIAARLLRFIIQLHFAEYK